jgi:2-polyprenyl-3-methyl-5-hydroxy-6-metoxy-1,4-benzoquinol methylase
MKKKKVIAHADQKSALSFKAIRNEYADLGVENYYRNHADVYENPHFPYIQQLLEQNQQRIDYTKVLDLACGGGEVTLILRGLGFDNTIGCDPFTSLLFEKNTHQTCLALSFEDIIKGALTDNEYPNNEYTSIISSFAMHLCPEKQLFSLVAQLFNLTNNIVIITPHKRPELEKLANVNLDFEDFVLTERGKKVFLKSYNNTTFRS